MGVQPSTSAVPDLSRRRFLQSLGAAGLLAGSGALAACTRSSPSTQDSTATTATAGKPRRGGTLRIGMVGAGKSESFNPGGASSALVNLARVSAVFDPLVTIGPDLTVRPALATRWTPNADHSVWTFTLRSGVTWHDGKSFTTADVVHSLNFVASTSLAPSVANVDLKRVRASGPNTVVVPLKSPDLLFPGQLANVWIVQNGVTSFVKPVGTGAFVFTSLSPGVQSVCARNPHYWDTGKPYVDSLVIKSITDDTARYNALLGGQIDVMSQLPFTQAKNLGAGLQSLSSPGVTAQAFYMDVRKAPFDDVRVRQALKLLADRPQLVAVALDGYGTVGNDLFGKGLQFYDSSLPQRTRDVATAKALLAQAGHGSGLSLTLQTSAAAPGMVQAATLFKQQAKAGNVDISISQVDPTAYFDPTLDYLKLPFAQTLWSGFNTLSSFYTYAMVPDGAGNETHWTKASTAAAIATAAKASDPAAAQAAWATVQKEQYDAGGYLWWGNVDNLDACSSRVRGITPSKYLNMGLPGSLADAYFMS